MRVEGLDLGGLVFKAQRRLYHSTVGVRVIKKKKGLDLVSAAVVDRVHVVAVAGSVSGCAGIQAPGAPMPRALQGHLYGVEPRTQS